MLHGLIFLILLAAANATPVLVRLALKTRWAYPLDGGACLSDGRPIFGPSKTIRGIVSAILVTTGAAWALGYSPVLGVGVAGAAMVGDLFSSFIKRRLGLRSSHDAYVLDQVPESFLPALVCRGVLELAWVDVAVVIAVFTVLDIILTRMLQKLWPN